MVCSVVDIVRAECGTKRIVFTPSFTNVPVFHGAPALLGRRGRLLNLLTVLNACEKPTCVVCYIVNVFTRRGGLGWVVGCFV